MVRQALALSEYFFEMIHFLNGDNKILKINESIMRHTAKINNKFLFISL